MECVARTDESPLQGQQNLHRCAVEPIELAAVDSHVGAIVGVTSCEGEHLVGACDGEGALEREREGGRGRLERLAVG